jgi:hypothetical protein
MGFIVAGVVLTAAAWAHHRYWWVVHARNGRDRPDNVVRDWRDRLDKWWGTLFAGSLAVYCLLAGIAQLVSE